MESKPAVDALSALAHEGRLAIFRTLVRAGPDGLAAGRLGDVVGMAGSTLSNNLTVLTRAGLTTSTRDGRSIIYSANYRRMTDLLTFLMQNCCEGSPDVCAPLGDVIAKAMCCQPQVG